MGGTAGHAARLLLFARQTARSSAAAAPPMV